MGFSRWGTGPGRGLPEVERARLRALVRTGASWLEVQDEFEVSHHTVWRILREANGMVPVRSGRCKSDLSLEEREEISRGLIGGLSFTKIAALLGRSPSTISREVERNGGRDDYRAAAADHATCDRAARPKQTVFEQNQVLKLVVETWLELNWSPEQISGRLKLEFPGDETMRVVPETIYQSLFVQGRGGLNKELTKHLRSQRVRRRPNAVTARVRQGPIVAMVNISDRPAEIEDRAVPGHWEGDLIIGKQGRSQAGTLVERTTGFTMLIALIDRTALTVAAALQRQISTLPAQACRSITWDQGIEMAAHAQFTIATNIPIYFCDPHSPWQRGTNENTNGLARQYLPKSTDLSVHTQADLDNIAAELNNRPRKRLQWKTPLESYNQLALH
jgi:transposase, IS30 family